MDVAVGGRRPALMVLTSGWRVVAGVVEVALTAVVTWEGSHGHRFFVGGGEVQRRRGGTPTVHD